MVVGFFWFGWMVGIRVFASVFVSAVIGVGFVSFVAWGAGGCVGWSADCIEMRCLLSGGSGGWTIKGDFMDLGRVS